MPVYGVFRAKRKWEKYGMCAGVMRSLSLGISGTTASR